MAVKHIMVLSGVADSGKTNTLNMLAEKLCAMHHSLLWAGSPLRQNEAILPTINPSMPTGTGWKDDDHWYCFDVSTRSNGHRIVAISTQGDNYDVCRKALDAFNATSLCPEVVVLASRSCWSKSVEAIETWNHNIMPSYTAIMIEPKTKQKTAVENEIVDRLYNEIA